MSNRNTFWQFLAAILLSNPFWLLIQWLFVKQPWQPRVVNTVTRSRYIALRAFTAAFGLPPLLLRWRRARLLRRGKVVLIDCQSVSTSVGTLSPSITPASGSLTMAMASADAVTNWAAPISRGTLPVVVNNSLRMQLEAALRHPGQVFIYFCGHGVWHGERLPPTGLSLR